jgi:hypothetical protein
MISRYLDGQKHERAHSFDLNRKFNYGQESHFQVAGPEEAKLRERCQAAKVDCGLERTLLRGGIERLQKMLSADGKARLIEAIRRYLRAHFSPEEFAEELYRIADECRLCSHIGGTNYRHGPSNRPALCQSVATGSETPVLALSSRPSKRSKIHSGTNKIGPLW